MRAYALGRVGDEMRKRDLVVARFRRGEMIKGRAMNFYPSHPTFRVRTDTGDQIQIKMSELKAVFFVKDLDGNTRHKRRRDFPAIRPPGAEEEKTAILFKDGEVLLGYLDSQAQNWQGFFVTPADVGGNNLRVYVINEAASYVATGSKAEQVGIPARQWTRPSNFTEGLNSVRAR
jgi:hypothetical protein